MPNITIRKVPKGLHERLKAQAEQHERSLNAEVLALLERALGGEAGGLARRIRTLREAAPPLDLDPTELKRAAREGLL